MQTQDEFIKRRRGDWDELDGLLARHRPVHRLPPIEISRTAALYRGVCADLMRARSLGYDAELVAYLDSLAGRGHNALYVAPPYRPVAAWELLARDFPQALRKNVRFFACAALLFLGPGLVGFVGALRSPEFAAEVLPQSALEQMEESYSKGFDKGRDVGADSTMAGFYVYNNVGIAFRCFATGILFGLGSVFFLIYNGLVIGTVMGFIARVGYGMNILTFCCGHASFELVAIVIAGGAGLQMGYALVATGGLTRQGSLRAQSREIVSLVLGAAAMLVIAALIEGFWSPSSAPRPVKWGAAVVLALLVAAYLALAGRRHEAAAGSPAVQR